MKYGALFFSSLFYVFLLIEPICLSTSDVYNKKPIKILLKDESEIWKLPLNSSEFDLIPRREKKAYIEAHVTSNLLQELKTKFTVEELQV
jgi:hypothetical protein